MTFTLDRETAAAVKNVVKAFPGSRILRVINRKKQRRLAYAQGKSTRTSAEGVAKVKTDAKAPSLRKERNNE